MKLVTSFLLSFLILMGCGSRKRSINQFTDEEIDEISFKIGVALTQNKPETLSSIIGLSQIMDSSVNLAKSTGLVDFQIERIGLKNPSNFNNSLKSTLTWLCYYSSLDGNVVLSSKTQNNEQIILTYIYSNPNNFFEILDFELITNGYQLFIGDIKMVHRDRKLSQWILSNISSPGYSESITEFSKKLEKAYEAGIQEKWDRAEYFYNGVPEEYLTDPMILEYSIPVTYFFDPALCIRIFNQTIEGCKDERAKVYWQIRRELFFQESDSLEHFIKEMEIKIGKNTVTQSLLQNEPNH